MLPRTFLRVARSSPVLRAHLTTPRAQHFPALRASRMCFATAPRRLYSTGRTEADEKIEEITEQYSTARDEFEIAVEETEKKTVYAADDRAAAAEEMKALRDMFDAALAETSTEVAAEIKRRVGGRIRELDEALKGLEQKALEE